MFDGGSATGLLLLISSTQSALGLLPLVVLVALTLLVASFGPEGPGRLRESLVIASVLTGLWVVVGTEVLSLFQGLSFWAVLAWWGVPGVAICVACIRRRGRLRGLAALPRAPWGVFLPLTITAAAVLLAGLLALVAPINTADVLVYHMPRQVHWMQQQSVEHYLTNTPRQLVLPPMAEFLGLHLMILSDGDLYVNLVQWLGLVVLAATASLIARELGAAALGQAMAALLVVTNPMAWLQAWTGKNDVVAAVWVLAAAFWIVRILRDGNVGIGRSLLIGAATGLAILTKLTGAMYLLPLLGVLGLWLLWQRRLVALPMAGTVLVIVLVLNAGHLARNVQSFGTPLASDALRDSGGRSHSNEIFGPRALASNILRNLALHAAMPSSNVNERMERAIVRAHEWMRIDPNDPRTTAYVEIKFGVRHVPWSDVQAGAPVHLLLVVVTIGWLPVAMLVWRARAGTAGASATLPVRATVPGFGIAPEEGARLALVLAGAIGAFVLFCLLTKWQVWHARLHIGLVSLFAPIVATTLCRGRGFGAIVICGLLLLPLAPASFGPRAKGPLFGPESVLAIPRYRHGISREQWAEVDDVVAFAQRVQPRVIGLRVRREYTLQSHLLRSLDVRPVFTKPLTRDERLDRRPLPAADLLILTDGAFPRVREHATGEMMYFMDQRGIYRIYAPEHVARRLYEQGVIDTMPTFVVPRAR